MLVAIDNIGIDKLMSSSQRQAIALGGHIVLLLLFIFGIGAVRGTRRRSLSALHHDFPILPWYSDDTQIPR